MKPSDIFLDDPTRIDPHALVRYLDEAAEQRAAFEQDITERVWALEAAAGKAPLCAECQKPLGETGVGLLCKECAK